MTNNHTTRLHQMTEIPEGLKVGDLLPAFAEVKHHVFVGKPSSECASCRKPFTMARKRRKDVLLYPIDSLAPVVFSFGICGRCVALHKQGGIAKDGVLASIQAYCDGKGADQ